MFVKVDMDLLNFNSRIAVSSPSNNSASISYLQNTCNQQTNTRIEQNPTFIHYSKDKSRRNPKNLTFEAAWWNLGPWRARNHETMTRSASWLTWLAHPGAEAGFDPISGLLPKKEQLHGFGSDEYDFLGASLVFLR